jgi:hypothetical protein
MKSRSIEPGLSKESAAFLEGFDEVSHDGDHLLFLKRRYRVLLDTADETLGGCIIDVRFWYEEFMPRLLAVCSIDAESLQPLGNGDDEAILDQWYEFELKERRFGQYGKDVIEGWARCSKQVKLSILRAWRLSRHYFMGPQKQRERSSESGVDHRQSGDLTQYVVFLDVYLQKSFVQEAGMRLTFPYFIGPTTWIWHHLVAERAAEWQADRTAESLALVEKFADYFKIFVTLYPCPYCRHHLNEFVYLNKERDLYPVEYLFVGWEPSGENLQGILRPGEKLKYIKDGRTLRLFVWKLHNAVSSSIERGESWYKATTQINTSRYWPNIEGELHRGMHTSGLVDAQRLRRMGDVLDCALRLSSLRDPILDIELENVEEMMEEVRPLLEQLDRTMEESGLLTEVFQFKPGLLEPLPDPDFYKKIEHNIRHEHFTIF